MNLQRTFTITLIVVSLLTATSFAQVLSGKVIAVKDGDTIEILHSAQPVRVRLAHIDSPEKNQPYGAKAKLYTSDLCFGRQATVNVTGKDRYGRSVGVVYINSQNINRLIVRNGFAWWYQRYSDDSTYRQLEQQARTKKLGLWAGKDPVPPWEWRRKHQKRRRENGNH